MKSILLVVVALVAVLAMLPGAAATMEPSFLRPPPPGTCIGGYNPNALSNVCYSASVQPGGLCVIGYICAPWPQASVYVEVLGIPVIGPGSTRSPLAGMADIFPDMTSA